MSKKIKFAAEAPKNPEVAEKWIEGRKVPEAPVKTRRVSVDLPIEVHAQLKVDCAARGVYIADEIRQMVEDRYSQKKPERGEG